MRRAALLNKMESKAEVRKRVEQKRALEEKLFSGKDDYILDPEEKVVADWMQEMLQRELVRYLYVLSPSSFTHLSSTQLLIFSLLF